VALLQTFIKIAKFNTLNLQQRDIYMIGLWVVLSFSLLIQGTGELNSAASNDIAVKR